MTILPKKKDEQDSDSDGDHSTHCAHSGPATHGSSHHTSDGEETFTRDTNTYYHRHYDSSHEDEEEEKSAAGFAVAKRGYHVPSASSASSRTKRADGGSPYASGYNSSEEYDAPRRSDPEMERNFELCLKKRGFVLKRMKEDGACLFRAVADQVYGDQEMHSVVRNHCLDYMMKNADYFSQFVTENFDDYIKRKRCDHCFGNNLEMQAMAEMYNRVIELYQYGSEPINIFFGVYKTDNAPIRLSYHGGVHYNSVVDPCAATIGVGLGLAGYKPGLADKTLINGALRESENAFLEQTMLEDKLRTTDWEATYEAVEDAVARESYLQWLKDSEKRPSTSKSVAQDNSMASTSNNPLSPPTSSASPSSSATIIVPATPTTSRCSLEDIKHQTTKQRGVGACSRSSSPARSRSPAHRSHSHQSVPSTTSSSRRSSPSRPSPHSSRHGSPCESRHRAGSARGSPYTSPRNSPTNSPAGSPAGSRHCSPSLGRHHVTTSPPHSSVSVIRPPKQPNGTRKTPPSSPSHSGTLYHPSAHQAEATSSQHPHTPDFESGAVLDRLPFECSSFLDVSPTALEWEDDQILAAVLAASQQEYIDTLKQNARTVDKGTSGV